MLARCTPVCQLPAAAALDAHLVACVLHLQAWDIFKQEWMQLRRSFRFNEYRKISALNPPKGPVGKVGV